METSGQYGPTHVSTSLGAQLQVSQSQSDSTAFDTSYQTVQRAVKSVTQTVTTSQAQRTVTRDSSYDDHKLENTSRDVTVGMYRWLSEVHYVELVKYPNRLVLEFEVPEPGAWLRWALQNTSTADWDHPYPGPFRVAGAGQDLGPADITADNYTQLARQWRVQGLSPPPVELIAIGARISLNPPAESPYPPSDHNKPDVPRIAFAVDETVTVPSGYQADSWSAQFIGYKGWGPFNFEEAWITVGAGPASQQTVWEAPDNPRLTGSPSVKGIQAFGVGGINTGTVPISVYAFEYLDGFSCNVTVNCSRQPETFAQWQQDTFDQVASAYQTLLNAYYTERDTRNQQLGGLGDLVGPPELNQARAVNELRRMVIQDLSGELLGGTQDVMDDGAEPFGTLGEPYVPAVPLTDTDAIQFFEQAIEWENIVYICYPYYWARHSQGSPTRQARPPTRCSTSSLTRAPRGSWCRPGPASRTSSCSSCTPGSSGAAASRPHRTTWITCRSRKRSRAWKRDRQTAHPSAHPGRSPCPPHCCGRGPTRRRFLSTRTPPSRSRQVLPRSSNDDTQAQHSLPSTRPLRME